MKKRYVFLRSVRSYGLREGEGLTGRISSTMDVYLSSGGKGVNARINITMFK